MGQPAPVTNDLPVREWYRPPGTNLEDSPLLTPAAAPDDTDWPGQIRGYPADLSRQWNTEARTRTRRNRTSTGTTHTTA